MNRIEIKSNEFKVLPISSDTKMLTTNLSKEIACIFFSKSLNKVSLGRNLTRNQISALLNKMSDLKNINDIIDVSIVGGLNCEESKRYLTELINNLFEIDDNKHFINIKAFDVCDRIHTHSIELDCESGLIYAI